MSSEAEESVRVFLCGGGNQTEGKVSVVCWTDRHRLIRAAKTFFACWIAAIISALIPIVHLISVPVLILIGIILPFVIYRTKSKVLGGKGKCPFCKADFSIVAAKDRWPLDDICTGCNRHVEIKKA